VGVEEEMKCSKSAAIAAFAERRKGKRRTAPKLARERFPKQPVLDDFECVFRKPNSASCKMAVDFWPFLF
jgi:hypothetical protein